MLTCKETARLAASGELAQRGSMARALVRLHLLLCSDCRRYVAELRAIGDAVRARYPETSDAERLARLQARIEEQGAQHDG